MDDIWKQDWLRNEFRQYESEERGGMVLVTMAVIALTAFGLGWIVGSLT